MYQLRELENWEIEFHRTALDFDDKCYYYMSYNSLSDLNTNDEKQMVKNIKITKEEIELNPPRAYYKDRDLKTAAQLLINSIKKYPTLLDYLWIPAPYSKAPTDKYYDDRLQKILTKVKDTIPLFNWFDAIFAKETISKSRLSNNRNIQQKLNNLGINKDFLMHVTTKAIMIFDDVLTTGSTFKSAQTKILECDNTLSIKGVFIAKAV